MNLTFKVPMQAEWSLLSDKLVKGNKEIILTDIKAVKLITNASIFTNGLIQITVKNRVINLAYGHKSKEDGAKALAYLQDHCGQKEVNSNRKSAADIKSEIDALECKDAFGTRKEISELPDILMKDENIKAMTSGLTDGNTWLMVCTNKRVLMLDKGMIYGLKLIDIPLDRINSISHSKGILLGTISLTDGATTRKIENISNTTIAFFADTVNREVEKYKQSQKAPVNQIVNSISTADELLKFKELLDMGVLTQEEFDTKKKELLGL